MADELSATTLHNVALTDYTPTGASYIFSELT